MTIRLGIVGFGMRARLYREAVATGEVIVTAVADPTPRGQADARAELGAEVLITGDLRELLPLVDAVLITTPDDLHAEPAIACLQAGKAVFCEKPLAITIEDCDQILRTAQETGSRLYVGHNMRHMPMVVEMKRLIDQGAIGAVRAIWCRHFVGNGGDFYFKDWHAERARTTGLLLQKGAHDLDVIHWLAGSASSRVQAMGRLAVYGDITDRRDRSGERMRDWLSADNWPPTAQRGLNPVIDVEDLSMVQLELENGVLASYEQCHFTPDYWRNYTVIGTEGRLENLGDESGSRIAIWNRRHLGAAEPDQVLAVPKATGGHGGADRRLMAEFLRFAAEGGPTDTSPVAAREAVAAGVLATESLRSDGGARAVPKLPADLVDYFDAGQPARAGS